MPRFKKDRFLEAKLAKQAFQNKIIMFVTKDFQYKPIIDELILNGLQRIFVQFEISKTGKVENVKARAPYVSL